MNVQLGESPQMLAAIRAGIMEAIKSPDFIRALAAEMGPDAVWLTAEQTRGLTQLAPSTFARWLKKNREKGLVISYAFGRKEPRYQFASVQHVIHQGRPDLLGPASKAA